MGSLLTVLLITLLAIPGAAAADAVTDWNEIAGAAAATARQGGTDASRTTALVHTAIFGAVNAVDPRYTPYKVKVTAPAGASAEAAAVAAAHAVLVRLYPDQKASLDQAYAKSLERIGNGSARAADAYVAVFEAKYTFNLWRPITAIRNGDIHGAGAMMRVADWEPLVDTPLHPEYPCAHCITSAAIAAVLEAEFGSTFPEVTMKSPTAPGVVRRWTSARAFADEVAAARIYGGIHYRTSTVVGQQMGKQIGDFTVQRYLKPVR